MMSLASLAIPISKGGRCLAHLNRQMSTGQEDSIYDIVIVGSGMVGSALAALLGSNNLTRNLKVAILDQQVQSLHPKLQQFPELRVSTIIPSSIACLKNAGAWSAVEEHAAMFSQMQVWDACGGGAIRWDARDLGHDHMGCVVENSVLQAALLAATERVASESTSMLWPASVVAMGLPGQQQKQPSSGSTDKEGNLGSGLAWLQLNDNRRLWTRLVVAADGSGSKVRALAGLRTTSMDYNQRGLVATVQTSDPGDRTAWQRFLPSGPMALLPVRGGHHNIVWSTTPDAARELEKMSSDDFAVAANKALNDPLIGEQAGGPLGHSVTKILQGLAPEDQKVRSPPLIEGWVGSSPRSFPLQLRQAGRYVQPRLALIGDAAHAVHPLAGQGVNLGLADAEALAKAIALACECGSDVGDVMILQEHYEAPRKAANVAMITALDAVKAAFAVQAPPFALLRTFGLDMINATGPVRNSIMKYAMGL